MQFVITKTNPHSLNLKRIKQHLRISHNNDDDVLLNICDSAICYAENFLNYKIMSKEVKVTIINKHKFYNYKLNLPLLYGEKILSVCFVNLNNKNCALLGEKYYSFSSSKIAIELSLPKEIEDKINTEGKNLVVAYQTKDILSTNPNIAQIVLLHIEQLYDKNLNLNLIQSLYQPYRMHLI